MRTPSGNFGAGFVRPRLNNRAIIRSPGADLFQILRGLPWLIITDQIGKYLKRIAK
jgi:hypothetical protein